MAGRLADGGMAGWRAGGELLLAWSHTQQIGAHWRFVLMDAGGEQEQRRLERPEELWVQE